MNDKPNTDQNACDCGCVSAQPTSPQPEETTKDSCDCCCDSMTKDK